MSENPDDLLDALDALGERPSYTPRKGLYTIEQVMNEPLEGVSTANVANGNETALIIYSEQGTYWHTQVGGVSCLQRITKGYCFNLGDYLQDINSCDCMSVVSLDMNELRDTLNEKFKDSYRTSWFSFSFTFTVNDEAISEMCEGWFPVKIFGESSGITFEATGAIHTGNCD